jgi:hypothetical protein
MNLPQHLAKNSNNAPLANINPAHIQNPENTNCKISSMALDEQSHRPKSRSMVSKNGSLVARDIGQH